MEQYYPIKSAKQAAAEWEETAPADEILIYYPVWTEHPILPAIFFSKSICDYVIELRQLFLTTKVKDMYIHKRAKGNQQLVSGSIALADYYYSKESHLFKTWKDEEPNIYSIDHGLRIVSSSNNHSPTSKEELHKIYSSSINFLQQINPSESWGYLMRPDLKESSVFSNFAALSTLHNIPMDNRKKLYLCNPEKIISGIRKNTLITNHDYIAFKRGSKQQGCLSTSEQAYRLLAIIDMFGADISKIDNFLHDNSKDVLNFIRECWDEESGGFCCSPETSSIPNMTHTKSGLQLIRRLLYRKDIEVDDIKWLNLNKVSDFVNSCISNNSFATLPKGQPTVCSLRNALNIKEILLIFTIAFWEQLTLNTHTIMSSIIYGLDLAIPFTASCIDNNKSQVYAYPIPVIVEWSKNNQIDLTKTEKMYQNLRSNSNDKKTSHCWSAEELADSIIEGIRQINAEYEDTTASIAEDPEERRQSRSELIQIIKRYRNSFKD